MQHPLGDDALPDLPQRETLTALFSSTARHGEWLPPEELRVVVGFGSAQLRRVTGGNAEPLAPDDDPPLLRITGYAIFGKIVVRVR